jgi:O-antigen ligase
MCAVCGLALLLSRSVTALIACVAGAGVLLWPLAAPPITRAPRGVQATLWVALATAIVAVGSSVGPITEALGRDATLNGRTPLWAASLRIMRERPLTGYGYNVVWQRQEGTLLPHIPETGWREAATAHNAVLNTATELGVPAALLLVVYFVGTLLDAARSTRYPQSSPYPYVTALLFALVTINLTESYVLTVHYVFWILWVAMAVMLRRNAQLRSPVV